MLEQIFLPQSVFRHLRDYVISGNSGEVCGLLCGTGDTVKMVYEVRNVAPNPTREFEMEPKALYEALVSIERTGQQLQAIFHSHPPDSRPGLSSADLAGLWGYTHVLHIVIVPESNDIALKAFNILSGVPAEVTINIVDED